MEEVPEQDVGERLRFIVEAIAGVGLGDDTAHYVFASFVVVVLIRDRP